MFWRHIVGRAQHLSGGGEATAGLGDAEVHDLGGAIGHHHDVGRLNVAMHYLVPGGAIQPGANLARDGDDLVHRQLVLLGQQLVQRLALDILHGDVEQAIGLAGVENGDDMWMEQHTRQPRLVAKALEQFFGVGAVDIQPRCLQRHRAANGGVGGFVHHSHGALAQRPGDLVAADFGGRHAGFPLSSSGKYTVGNRLTKRGSAKIS